MLELFRTLRRILISLICVVYAIQGFGESNTIKPDDKGIDLIFDKNNLFFDENSLVEEIDIFPEIDSDTSFWGAYIFDPMRITLAHELAYKIKKPKGMLKNRSSVQMEYSKYFFENYYLQIDAKTTAFFEDDHRKEVDSLDTFVSQAYLQTSFGKTSIKVGIQTVVWGESILAPITDEVSPRDNRELFNLNLEELRIGQPMLTVEEYSEIGHWSLFLTPDPKFNENPEEGSAYYFDPFNGSVRFQTQTTDDEKDFEYGISWKKTFGSADISLMAASLIDNEYALRLESPGLMTRVRQQFSLVGTTFNYAVKNFLFKGEFGMKSPKTFNNGLGQIIEKNELDVYLGIEYSPSSSLTLSLEGVNQHIANWSNEIKNVPRNRQIFLLSLSKLMMHDDLSLELINIYNGPNNSLLTMLLTSYEWDDNLTLEFNINLPNTDDEKSNLWKYRDQKQVAFKIKYQF